MKEFHLISGLPRTGSTLLASILSQNPQIHAAITSPVLGLIDKLTQGMSQSNESALLISDRQRRSIVEGLVRNYYGEVDREIVFDTNRMWTSKMSLIVDIFPRARVVACVRGIADIVNSFELLHRKNKFEASGVYGYDPSTNVYMRADILLDNKGIVATSLQSLREAYYGPHADQLLLVRYESLLSNPQKTMAQIYDFVSIKAVRHDFDKLQGFQTDEYDRRLGVPGLHSIRRKLEKTRAPMVLPPDIISRCSGHDFWSFKHQSNKAVKCI